MRPVGLEKVRQQAEAIETETRNFYRSALERASDAEIRKLLGDLIAAEDQHVDLAHQLSEKELTSGTKAAEAQAERRAFVLR